MMMERTRVCLGGDEDARIERIKSKRESRLTETNDPASGAHNRRRRFGEVRITTSCACRTCTDWWMCRAFKRTSLIQRAWCFWTSDRTRDRTRV